MKHLLNNLSEEEKNSIREQHTGGMKVSTTNFSKLVESKLGDVEPLDKININEDIKSNAIGMYESHKRKIEKALHELENFIQSGDKDTALHLIFVIRHSLKELDSFVEEIK